MQSNELNELAIALNALQAELRPAVKDSQNPFYKSKYADLESVWDACRDPLIRHGLCVIQTLCPIGKEESNTGLKTTLLHVSGQYIDGIMPLMPIAPNPQAQGSAITYARRYALAAILGIVQTDDDAEIATPKHQAPAQKADSLVDWSKVKAYANMKGWENADVLEWIKSKREAGVTDMMIEKAAYRKFETPAPVKEKV